MGDENGREGERGEEEGGRMRKGGIVEGGREKERKYSLIIIRQSD